MKYYHRRVYSDYRQDLETIKKHGMPDTDDSVMMSKEFSYWAAHIMEIAHRKNVEYASVGVLDRNDLIQVVSQCFIEAWSRVNWERINNVPADERQKALWGFLKSSTEMKLGTRIREVKDGIKVPDREMFVRSDDRRSESGVLFDAITSMFPQLKLEMNNANIVEEETSYNNDVIVDILQPHFKKFIKNDKHIFVLERSLGIDGPKMKSKEIASRIGSSESSVENMRSKAIKKLKTEESMRELAFTLDGRMVETGADILKFL